ncbi:MAG: hypothetical protein JO147_14610 [Actinobacteria bacterium]|nr:hypothetical protein [Actinomycetota bacterium]
MSLGVWSWALWLSAPVAVTLLAAAVLAVRGRPAKPRRTHDVIAEHEAYLQALGDNASRVEPEVSSPEVPPGLAS